MSATIEVISWSGVAGDTATIRWTADPGYIAAAPEDRPVFPLIYSTYDITSSANKDYIPVNFREESNTASLSFKVKTLPHKKNDLEDEIVGIRVTLLRPGYESDTETSFVIRGLGTKSGSLYDRTSIIDDYGLRKAQKAVDTITGILEDNAASLYPYLKKYFGNGVTKKDAKTIRRNFDVVGVRG